MLANQTAVTTDGYEVCLFPMDYMNCTQRGTPGDMDSYSHCCTYACDWTGPVDEYPVYAPFTGQLVTSGAENNRCYFQSLDVVQTPTGLKYVTLELVHSDTAPAAGIYQQGQLIYHTGIAGNVTGDHVHIDQSPVQDARLIGAGYACRGSSTGQCWLLNGTAIPTDVFYTSGDESIVNLRGLTFTEWSGGTGFRGIKIWMLKRILERKRNGNL